MSKPDYIPDMSLGDRDDKPPPPPIPAPIDVTSSYQPKEVPASPPQPAAPPDWQEGDRVLAPWEPMFLYSGTIKQIKLDDARGDLALVEFDDGDDGWVQVYSLCPIEVMAGQKVFSRRRMGPHFFAAEVLEIAGEEVHVQFHEGGTEWTTIAALRIPCIENGPGAVGTRFGSNRLPQHANPQPTGSGVPSWVWTVGLIILFVVLRAGCRSMMH